MVRPKEVRQRAVLCPSQGRHLSEPPAYLFATYPLLAEKPRKEFPKRLFFSHLKNGMPFCWASPSMRHEWAKKNT